MIDISNLFELFLIFGTIPIVIIWLVIEHLLGRW